MTTLDKARLKQFHNTLLAKALQAGDPTYVDGLHKIPTDKIHELATSIEWNINRSGVYLFTGMPGTGKTTELHRLEQQLESDGHVVLFVNGEDYFMQAAEIEISDFLLTVLIGFIDTIEVKFSINILEQKYAERLVDFLKSEVGFEPSLTVDMGMFKTSLKANLKSNTSFKQKLQTRMAGTLATLLLLIQELVDGICTELEKKLTATDSKIVVLIDSLEKLHGDGIGSDASKDPALQSLRRMWTQHVDNLAISGLHIVYSVPPYLLKLAPGLDAQVDGICHLSSGHVFQGNTHNQDDTGLAIFREVITKRFPDWPTLLTEQQLNLLITQSGGDLREFFSLLRKVILDAASRSLQQPVTDDVIDNAIQSRRRDYLPLAGDVKERLRYAMEHFEPYCATEEDLDKMIRDLYLRRIVMFRNGKDWYLPNPLLWQEIKSTTTP